MKKQFFFMFSALAVALPLSLSLQSCSDDDDEESPAVVAEQSGVYYGGEATVSYDVAVDLGLSVKWASYNVGASSPEEYGNYYAWGETEPKEDYSWDNYLKALGATMTSYSDCNTDKDPLRNFTKGGDLYNVATTPGVTDGIGSTKYDVARVKWAGTWRMPTKAEIEELLDSCTWTWTNDPLSNVTGYRVQSKVNGNSIFLPTAGYKNNSRTEIFGIYWSSTPSESSSDAAYGMGFYSEKHDCGHDRRCYGRSVRPVIE